MSDPRPAPSSSRARSLAQYAAAAVAAARSQAENTPATATTSMPAAPTDNLALVAALNMRMRASIQQTVAESAANRPKSTRASYAGYRKDWQNWCAHNKFPDGDTVHALKLHMYLQQQIIGRKSKKTDREVGFKTVQGTVSGIISLYDEQVAMGTNSNPRPRDHHVKQILKNLKAKTAELRRTNYDDRGTGSLLAGYHDIAQFEQITSQFFQINDLRGRTAFLLSHFGLLRGQTCRTVELADCFLDTKTQSHQSEAIALVLLLDAGKTNQFGKKTHVGFLRNVNVNICPVGAMAFWMFQRFHVDLEPFPTFTASEEWYDIKLFPGRTSRTSEWSYDSHSRSFKKVFDQLGLTFDMTTHVNRKQGVRDLEAMSVDSSQTKRHGQWTTDTCDAVYCAPLAREAMRAFSGHTAKGSDYYIARSNVVPPLELQQLIFPTADEWLRRVKTGDGCAKNLAAVGFLELIIYLRRVILQDVAVLIGAGKDYDMLSDPIFVSDNFQRFKLLLLQSIAETIDPARQSLTTVIPDLMHQMTADFGSIRQDIACLHQISNQTNGYMQDLVMGRVEIKTSSTINLFRKDRPWCHIQFLALQLRLDQMTTTQNLLMFLPAMIR